MSPSNVQPEQLQIRQRKLTNSDWYQPYQIHSADVLTLDEASSDLWADRQRRQCDGLVTSEVDRTIAVLGADCPCLGFVVKDCAVAVIHAGWKGLEANIIETGVQACIESSSKYRGDEVNADEVHCVIGPSICALCYEFGMSDLQRLAKRFGPDIISETRWNTPALDLNTLIRNELARLKITKVTDTAICTACDEQNFWSHRKRADKSRHCLFAHITLRENQESQN